MRVDGSQWGVVRRQPSQRIGSHAVVIRLPFVSVDLLPLSHLLASDWTPIPGVTVKGGLLEPTDSQERIVRFPVRRFYLFWSLPQGSI